MAAGAIGVRSSWGLLCDEETHASNVERIMHVCVEALTVRARVFVCARVDATMNLLARVRVRV